MLDQYLIIHKSILPEYYEKVIEARRLLEDATIKASVTISLDVSEVDGSMESFVACLGEIPGVEQLRVLAVE